MKKNKPYTRPGYTPTDYTDTGYGETNYEDNRFGDVDYKESRFEENDYARVRYAEADTPSGADVKDQLLGKINIKDARAAVVGLGYVGLPLATEMARAGFACVGVDVDGAVVKGVNDGTSHVGDVASDDLKAMVASGKLRATDDYGVLTETDCISITVPTPLTKTKEPDIGFIVGAVNALLPALRPGQLVVLESTTYPGTTEELVAARIEKERGLKVGTDIFVAFSPERVDPGNTTWNTKNTPKVVGGITPACTEVARAYYSAIVNTVHVVNSAREAETVKILENTFRAVNIALVNEFLLMCDRLDIDVWSVVEAASTKPFGFMPFHPGPGIGGHCIPLDPMYMSWKAKSVDFYNRFIELATDINGNMPRFVLARIADILNDAQKSINGATVLILGMAYKKNVADLRESPGLEIFKLLEQKGATVQFCDPHANSFEAEEGRTVTAVAPEEGLKGCDLALLVTDHDGFDYQAIANSGKAVLDCRDGFGKHGIHETNIIKL